MHVPRNVSTRRRPESPVAGYRTYQPCPRRKFRNIVPSLFNRSIAAPRPIFRVQRNRPAGSRTVIRDTKRKLWTFSFTPGTRFRLLGTTLSVSLLGDVYRRYGPGRFMNNSSAINCNLGDTESREIISVPESRASAVSLLFIRDDSDTSLYPRFDAIFKGHRFHRNPAIVHYFTFHPFISLSLSLSNPFTPPPQTPWYRRANKLGLFENFLKDDRSTERINSINRFDSVPDPST